MPPADKPAKQERYHTLPEESVELEPVKMRHYYPKETVPRLPRERKEGSVSKKKTEMKSRAKRETSDVRTGSPQRKQPAEVPDRPVKKKTRPSAYGSGPFKAQEIPSPIRGLKLEQERRKEYRQKIEAEHSEEKQRLEIPVSAKTDTADHRKEETFRAPDQRLPADNNTVDSNDVFRQGASSAEEKSEELKTEERIPLQEKEAVTIRPSESEAKVTVVEENSLHAEKTSDKEVNSSFEPSVIYEEDVPEEEVQIEEKMEDIQDNKQMDTAQRQIEAVPVRIEEKSSSEKNGNTPQPAKPSKKESGKPAKPFNVMMTPADRARAKRAPQRTVPGYTFPPLNLLDVPPQVDTGREEWAEGMSRKLNETFSYFRIQAEVVTYTSGPSVTRFEVQPEPGVKISKIVQLTDDLKRSLAATEIRLEAPIPGKTTVGIEVPNPAPSPVMLRTVLKDKNFRDAPSPLTVALGVDISGNAVVTDITSMPHGLIAGTTGSGKSVCVNSMLTSILYKASPEEVRMLLIDPKMVELAPFNSVPHLAAPVITDTKEATAALNWAVEEMERRYQLFADTGARDLSRYNAKAEHKLPKLLIVVDELADLMMVAPSEVEDAVCRIAQKARACGIHLLVATQRPSVDVITGLIKANIPSRIAFSVSSAADSRTILDSGGAERLLGRGDMLFHPNSSPKPVRIQGTFVTDDEIDRVIEFAGRNDRPAPLFDPKELKEIENTAPEDRLFDEAREFVIEKQTASTSLLQRRFQVGYNRAARLIDELEAHGVVSPANGSKPRDVYTGLDRVT
ncbi:MAG: DNA translocase FtsK [Alkalicoccus sp.]|nr:MAG: DNA translocase FtsK [Alkalicoccus sp.]